MFQNATRSGVWSNKSRADDVKGEHEALAKPGTNKTRCDHRKGTSEEKGGWLRQRYRSRNSSRIIGCYE